MPSATGWSNPDTARAYAEFTRRHPMYRETSRDLVEAAGIDSGDRLVVDLACGTGMTCEQVLERLPPDGRLVAVDASPAMLGEARRTIDDARVQWIGCRVEEVDRELGEDSVDVAVCNSAIWQSDMATTLAAVQRILRPGGRFAFNIGRQFIAMPYTDAELNPTHPGLHEFLQAFAVIDHSHVPPRGAPRGGPLTVEAVTDLLSAAGLAPTIAEEHGYDDTIERQRDWLSIPIFTERQFPDLTYDQRMDALAKAFERTDRTQRSPRSRWMVFVGQKQSSGAAARPGKATA